MAGISFGNGTEGKYQFGFFDANWLPEPSTFNSTRKPILPQGVGPGICINASEYGYPWPAVAIIRTEDTDSMMIES